MKTKEPARVVEIVNKYKQWQRDGKQNGRPATNETKQNGFGTYLHKRLERFSGVTQTVSSNSCPSPGITWTSAIQPLMRKASREFSSEFESSPKGWVRSLIGRGVVKDQDLVKTATAVSNSAKRLPRRWSSQFLPATGRWNLRRDGAARNAAYSTRDLIAAFHSFD